MSEQTAEELNDRGSQLKDSGDIAGAEAAYRAAAALAPDWSAPFYNLGLMYKYLGKWRESLEYNKRAAELNPADEASWWNLGIAATALGDWTQARRAWAACDMTAPPGEGAPDFGWGLTPVRLEPEGDAEVVWARRIDPARAEIGSLPLPTSPYRWRDVVLTDGAEEGQRISEGRVYPVFNALQLLTPSFFRTFVIELGTANEHDINALGDLAIEAALGAEYWGNTTHTLCKACSLGLPDGHIDHAAATAFPHFGIAAQNESEVSALLEKWRVGSPTRDVVRFYGVPRPL